MHARTSTLNIAFKHIAQKNTKPRGHSMQNNQLLTKNLLRWRITLLFTHFGQEFCEPMIYAHGKLCLYKYQLYLFDCRFNLNLAYLIAYIVLLNFVAQNSNRMKPVLCVVTCCTLARHFCHSKDPFLASMERICKGSSDMYYTWREWLPTSIH